MHRTLYRLALLSAALVALLQAGCARQAAEPGVAPPAGDAAAVDAPPAGEGKSILLISNANSPFWDAVEAGVEAGSEETGVEAHLQRNTEASTNGQIRLLEQALAQKDDLLGVGISVLRPDADGILEAMAALQEAGVTVITLDSDAPADTRRLFVGTDNREAGEQLGEQALKELPDGGRVCVFVGDPSAQNARERLEGFKAGAGPKFEVLEVYQDNTDVSRARSNVETALTAHPDANVMVGLWSYNGPAIAEVVQAAEKGDAVTVLCFDAEPALLPLLADGHVAATVVQRPYEIGRQSVLALHALAQNKGALLGELDPEQDGVINTGTRVVTPTTFADFKSELDAKGLTGS